MRIYRFAIRPVVIYDAVTIILTKNRKKNYENLRGKSAAQRKKRKESIED